MATATQVPKKKRTGGKYSKTNPNPSLEPIKPDVFYSRQQIMDLLGWGPRAWRSAKNKGLAVANHASRDYVEGAELIRYLRSLATPQQDNS